MLITAAGATRVVMPLVGGTLSSPEYWLSWQTMGTKFVPHTTDHFGAKTETGVSTEASDSKCVSALVNRCITSPRFSIIEEVFRFHGGQPILESLGISVLVRESNIFQRPYDPDIGIVPAD